MSRATSNKKQIEVDIGCARAFLPLTEPRRYKGAVGGRGSGKSHFFCELLISECIRKPRTRAVCIREIQRTLAESSKRTIEDKIRSMGLQSLFKITDKHIETPGGGIIIFVGMQNHTADSIKSLEGYRIGFVEEAHRLSQYSLDLLYPTFRQEDSELWFAWNRSSPMDAVDRFFNDNKSNPAFLCVQANYDNNPWFPAVLRLDMERDRHRDPEKYRHIWLGQYQTRSEARVFHNWQIDDFETPEYHEEWAALGLIPHFYFGADWGFANDPTVLVRCWLKGRTLLVDHEAWQVGCEMDHTPRLFESVPESRRWPIIADSSNPQAISYMRRHGYPKIFPSVKGVGSVEEGIEFMKSYDIVVHKRCNHVIDELSSYSYEIDPHTEEVLPVLADRKNHTIDAVRYALERIRRAGGKAGFGRY